MAKGKHATALFEVIHTAKRPPQASPAAQMPPPRSWWKGKSKSDEAGTSDGNERPSRLALMGALLSPSRASKLRPESSWIEPAELPPPPPPASLPPPRMEPLSLTAFDTSTVEFDRPMRLADHAPHGPKMAEASGGEITFRLSYGGAIAAGLILLLLVAIAYLAGTRLGEVGFNGDDTAPRTQSPSPTASVATADPAANGGMLAAVTTVPAAASSAVDSNSVPPPSAAPAANMTHQLISPPAQADSPDPTEARRQIGKTYVIVQSYPDADVAAKARDFLAKHGIQCTVIRALPGWALRSWYSVVSLRPFDHTRDNPSLDAYEDRLTSLGEFFAGHTSFNRFEPKLYRWRTDADAAVNGDR